MAGTTDRIARPTSSPDRITEYCCFLQSVNTGAHGSGFIVELKDLRSAKLLVLDWKERGKTGELQTDYALITSHDTIPGSISALKNWTVSCQGIENGSKKTLSDLVCGVISCCGPESVFDPGHQTQTKHYILNAGCQVKLNITILFLKEKIQELLQESGAKHIVFPPVISVPKCLNQEANIQEYEQIISSVSVEEHHSAHIHVYYCDRVRRLPQTTAASLVVKQVTVQEVTSEQQETSASKGVLKREIAIFEKFQKIYYRESSSSTLNERCYGSPVVYHNPASNECSIIAIHVGVTDQKGKYVAVTLHGILQTLQGGLIPVLSIWRWFGTRLWTSKWAYLVTPHIEAKKSMECGYVCEVLHYLLKKRLGGTSFVELSTILADVDNKAALDLLCALFKHIKAASDVDSNKAVTKLYEWGIDGNIKQLCDSLLKLLHAAVGRHMQVRHPDRTSLVEKCCIFYKILLNINFAGITEQILGTSENLKLLEKVCNRYGHSDVVQQNATDITSKRSSVETLENQRHYEAYQQALKKGIGIKLKYLKMLFFGPPRTGKTSMRRRLVGEIKNLTNEPVQASTGTAEHYDVIVKLFEDKTTHSPAVITKSEWSNVKALFGEEKCTHETDLDEELQFLYQSIYRDAPPVVPQTENKSSIFPIEMPESNKSRSLVPNPVTEEEAQNILRQSPARVQKVTVASTVLVEASPNVSPQKISSDREHGLSAEQMEEIKKAFEAFDKVLRTGGHEKIKELLDGTILMNMVDTGGHPAFLEMLPALTMGPALYLIFFRLNQELKNTYQIQFVSENNENIQLGGSSYTVEEVIFQALSSIAYFSYIEPKENMPSPSRAAMLVGTHKDRLGCNPETIAHEVKSKDAALKNILKTDFLRYASDDQLMFAIDNMTGEEEELRQVRKRLEDVIKQEFDDFSIPASWLMFSVFLRKMGKRVMSLSQCHEIGERLDMKDTNEALWFLHHHVGILMHFSDVEDVKDVVICDPQVVFDSVTDLILNSFELKQVSKAACDKFKKNGQFSFKDIQKIARNNSSDHLPLPELVKLLEHLNIIAPTKPHSSPQSDARHEVFFMPAVLDHATEKELHMEQRLTDPVPLVVHFKCGFVPVGVFCAMIACLVAQEGTLGWILLEPGDGHKLCKNKVTFRINGAYNITLISKPKQYEIHIVRIADTDRALEEICQHVVETVCDILDQVISKMKYERLVSSHSNQTLYELGFKCPKHSNEDHLVINRPKGGAKSPLRSAKFLWFNYLANPRKSTMICLKEGIAINLKDTSFSESFAQQSLVWFGEATEISFASPAKDTCHDIQSHGLRRDQELAKELNVKNIVNVLDEAKFADGEWAQLGLQLIDHFDSTTIRADHGRASDCMIDTIFQWLRTDTKASWEKLAEAVTKVKGYGGATAASILQKAGIVHTENQSIASGVDVTFTVEATEDHLQFQWQKNGEAIDSSQFSFRQTDCSSTLRIQFVGKSDEGHYKCLVKSRKSLHTSELEVFDSPMIAQDPETRATAGKRKQLEEKQHINVEMTAAVTSGKRKQSSDKEQGLPKKRRLSDVKDVAKPATVTGGKRKQSRGEEQGVPKKRRSSAVNVEKIAAVTSRKRKQSGEKEQAATRLKSGDSGRRPARIKTERKV